MAEKEPKFAQGDKTQVEKVEVTDDGSNDGIKKIIVTRRDPAARWTATGCAVLTAVFVITDVLINYSLRQQSPIGEPELAIYREDLKKEAEAMKSLKLQLEDDMIKTRLAGYAVLQVVSEGKMSYQEYSDQIDTLYKKSKDLASATKPLKK